jgi:hypothetical protein
MNDKVNHPLHYTAHPSKIECIQVTEHMNFCLGNAIKYIWRADLKNDAIEDLEKARWYIDREIAKRKLMEKPNDKINNMNTNRTTSRTHEKQITCVTMCDQEWRAEGWRFAKQLERELAEAWEQRDALVNILTDVINEDGTPKSIDRAAIFLTAVKGELK